MWNTYVTNQEKNIYLLTIIYNLLKKYLILLLLLASCCRIIGPEMPSAELLAAAAKLTEAQAELRYFLEKVQQMLLIYLRVQLGIFW